jgi:hypothetical protein
LLNSPLNKKQHHLFMKFTNLFLVGITLFLLTSCGEASIEKKWKLEDITIEELLKTVPIESKEMMVNGIKESVTKTKGKLVLDFQKEGKIVTENPNMDETITQESGTWKISDDKKMVTITMEGQPQDFTIHELTKDKLVIEPLGEKMNLVFVEKK